MRKAASIALLISFILVSVTGVQMDFTPKSPKTQQVQTAANGEGEMSQKRSPSVYPKKVHDWAGYVFIGAGLVHLVLNRKIMLAYVTTGKNVKK